MSTPEFIDEDGRMPDGSLIKPSGTLAVSEPEPVPLDPGRVAERRKLFRGRMDLYLLLVVGVLLAIGLMMVFSTTFDWSYQEFGDAGAIFMRQARSVGIGLVVMILLALIDYRIWKRFALWMMLAVIALLIALLATAPELFGAQRAFVNGSLQPGELAQLVTILYMAAWLSAKQTKIRRLSYGLLPFTILLGTVTVLIVLQPDLSTAILIVGTAVVMFFLAGADLLQIGLTVVIGGAAGCAAVLS
jgi:cell division protein FtsW